MWVTCYTDAGWHPSHNIGAWAYTLKCDQGSYTKSGNSPSWVSCSNTAEMSAIIAGVYRAVRHFEGVVGVGVRTDSMTAISYLKTAQDEDSLSRKDWVILRRRLYRILDKYNCRVNFTHVKGHQRASSTQAYLNNKMDRMCTECMSGQIKKRRKH